MEPEAHFPPWLAVETCVRQGNAEIQASGRHKMRFSILCCECATDKLPSIWPPSAMRCNTVKIALVSDMEHQRRGGQVHVQDRQSAITFRDSDCRYAGLR